jgi:hypothetical protein
MKNSGIQESFLKGFRIQTKVFEDVRMPGEKIVFLEISRKKI